MAAEREILGLLADSHVISLYREWMVRQGILGSRELTTRRDGQTVRVAGQNVIVRPSVYAHYRKTIRHLPLLMVEGKVQREGAVTNVLCHRAMHVPYQ